MVCMHFTTLHQQVALAIVTRIWQLVAWLLAKQLAFTALRKQHLSGRCIFEALFSLAFCCLLLKVYLCEYHALQHLQLFA
jgi:hypothetical protein